MTERSKRQTEDYVTELEDRIEQLEALIAIERTKGDEMVPQAIVTAILAGENPVKTWRKYRGLTLAELSDATEGVGRRVDVAYISEIERGVKPGSFAAMGAISRALGVDLEDLAPNDELSPARKKHRRGRGRRSAKALPARRAAKK